MKRTDWLLCLAKNCDWLKFKIQNFKKTWIERCLHLCVCPLIDHRRELIRMQELLGLLYKKGWHNGWTKLSPRCMQTLCRPLHSTKETGDVFIPSLFFAKPYFHFFWHFFFSKSPFDYECLDSVSSHLNIFISKFVICPSSTAVVDNLKVYTL